MLPILPGSSKKGVVMYQALILAKETADIERLCSGLACQGIACTIAKDIAVFSEMITNLAANVLLVKLDNSSVAAETESLLKQLHHLKTKKDLPLIALASEKEVSYLDSVQSIDDFVVKPWKLAEVIVRIKRAVTHANRKHDKEVMKHGNLIVDTVKCEVSLNGRVLALTFKEYELLKFLVQNKGKVFTRQALLSKVWGYEYYGGERTVDVHIRRLRTKLDDYAGSYIQTVRNIGYRFNEKAIP